MAARRPDLVIARTPFFSGNLLVRAGEVWASTDQVVVGNPRAFGPLTIRSSGRPAPIAEQAGAPDPEPPAPKPADPAPPVEPPADPPAPAVAPEAQSEPPDAPAS